MDWALWPALAGFGLLIGVMFGFFGMGGTFLITPALLILGFPAPVAVGSGMAFVFGTAVIAALKHRELGQVDARLGAAMVAGTAGGIELGKRAVFALQALGAASAFISLAYVALLLAIGTFTLRDARPREKRPAGELPPLAARLQRLRLPPHIPLRRGGRISLWIALCVGFCTGTLSGLLGVGGGFIRLPALVYLIGVPVSVAIGTDLFEIVFSGGIGTFLYAREGGVDLTVVVPLLAGSALGAQLGGAATQLVRQGEIKALFGGMALVGALAVGLSTAGALLQVPVLGQVGLGAILAAALLVNLAVAHKSLRAVRAPGEAS